MSAKWLTRSEQAKTIAEDASALARRTRSAWLDVAAYKLKLAAAGASKEIEDEGKIKD